jgi:hypothetical protein
MQPARRRRRFGHNSTITIKGVTYRVRSPRKVGDGQESIVDLATA